MLILNLIADKFVVFPIGNKPMGKILNSLIAGIFQHNKVLVLRQVLQERFV